MTKHNKDQPRDGNGKFAKMIKVADKYGNTAYFTPEEMKGFKLPEKNPDCDPATKGYVKSLIGKTREHTHRFDNFSFFSSLGTLCGAAATLAFAMGMGTTPVFVAFAWYPPVGPSLAFTLACLVFFLDTSDIGIGGIKEERFPRELMKYTPPHKDECEKE